MKDELANLEAGDAELHPAVCESAELRSQATGPRTILLVEDEAFVRDVMGEVLEVAGYHVVKTQSAEDALSSYEHRNGDPDLLLTDVVMPGRSGRELARELRKQTPGMKTLFMSGYGESAALLGAERDASVFYLAKPFSVPGLLRKVEEVFGHIGGPSAPQAVP